MTAISDTHHKMLRESAISPALIDGSFPDGTRRYQTVQNARLLIDRGFSAAQSHVPGLLITYRNASGTMFYQYRPDHPAKNRPKYETPYGKPGKYGLDIPESVRNKVLNGLDELWITEGSKKADAAVSAGLCCVSLSGVWMFMHDRKPLSDWGMLLLCGRVVIICYDSDAMTKKSVYDALRRLANLLKEYGAKVRFCYLPDEGEKKIGLDDYLSNGHSIDDLRGLVSDQLKPIATAPVKALIAVLNHKCEGICTFVKNRCDFSGENEANNAIAALSEIFCQKHEVDKQFKLWAGDAYAALKLPYGTKEDTVKAAIGEGNFHQVRGWTRIASAFRGERDYFRDVAPWWFLDLTASRSDEEQDELLSEYLQRSADGKNWMTRDELRGRLRGKSGKSLPPKARHEDGGSSMGQALSALIMRAKSEDRELLSELNETYGAPVVSETIARFLPDGLHWILEQAKMILKEQSSPLPSSKVYTEEDPPPISSTYYNTGSTFDTPQEESKVTAAVTFERRDEIKNVGFAQRSVHDVLSLPTSPMPHPLPYHADGKTSDATSPSQASTEFADLLLAAEQDILPTGIVVIDDETFASVAKMKNFVLGTFKGLKAAERDGDEETAAEKRADLEKCRKAWQKRA